MDLNHLHLHVRDVERSRRFYASYFGFCERVRHGDILFLRNDHGFDLALAPDPAPAPLPAWFHFGFRLTDGDAVRALLERMSADGVALVKPLHADPTYVTYSCSDPDGHRIEVYWE